MLCTHHFAVYSHILKLDFEFLTISHEKIISAPGSASSRGTKTSLCALSHDWSCNLLRARPISNIYANLYGIRGSSLCAGVAQGSQKSWGHHPSMSPVLAQERGGQSTPSSQCSKGGGSRSAPAGAWRAALRNGHARPELGKGPMGPLSPTLLWGSTGPTDG